MDDDDLDRVPIPPGQDPTGGQVKPLPTPFRWAAQKVGHNTEGEPIVMLKFWMITGETTLFMPASGAQRLADLLFSTATGIHLAGPS